MKLINMTARGADLKCSINQQHAPSWPLKLCSDFNIKNNEEGFLQVFSLSVCSRASQLLM